MNPAGFQGMPGSGMIPQGLQQPQRYIQAHIMQSLKQQPQPQGWQATVPINQRAIAILQLVTSLRLIQPQDLMKTVTTAQNFERTAFTENQDKDSYERACKQKLSDIQETRAKQARIMMQQMQNPQPPPMNSGQQPMPMQGLIPNQNQVQFQHGFPNHQMQQPMRPPGMGVPAALMPQQPQLPMGNPQTNMHQIHRSMHPQMLQPNGHAALTTEEQGIINQMAQLMMHRASEEQLNAVRNQMQKRAPEQRQLLQARRIDPILYYFRSAAISKFLENKAKMANERANQQIPPPNNGLIPQQARPPSQNPVWAHGPQPSTQMFEPSFGAGMNQILGQQRDALRLQEAGQVVVPASSGQLISDPQIGNIRGTPQQQQNVQPGGNHQTNQQPTAHYWANSNSNMQQPPHMPVSQQGLNFAHMPPHPLHGQIGGLNNHPRMPPQNPALPNINQATSPESRNTWPPQRPSQVTQPKEPIIPGPQQAMQQPGAPPLEPSDTAQNRQRLPAEIQLKLQQHLATATLNEDQKKEVFRGVKQRNRQQFLIQQRQQPQQHQKETAAKGSDSEPTEGQNGQNTTQTIVQQPPPHACTNTMVNNGSQQSAIPQQSAPTIPGQPPPQARAAAQGPYSLTEEQTRHMDNSNFPPPILNTGSYLSKLPSDIKTWGQLKSWVAQNEHALPPVTLSKLQNLQAMHFHNLGSTQKRQPPQGMVQPMNAQAFQQPSAPTAPMVPPKKIVQGVNPSPPAFNVMLSTSKPTIQEIQAFRAQWSERMPGISDEQAEMIIMRQRQDFMMKGYPKPSQKQTQFNNLPRHQGQQIPPPVNQPMQIPQPPTPQRSQPQQNPRSVAAAKDSVSKQTLATRHVPKSLSQSHAKGVKRNNNDVVEAPLQQDAYPKPQISMQSKPTRSQNFTDHFPAGVNDIHRQMQADHSQALSAQSVNQDTKVVNRDQQRVEAQKREIRLKQIVAEVIQSIPPRQQPIQVDANGKASIARTLQTAKDHIQNAERALPRLFMAGGDEDIVKKMFHTRLLLLQQYRDTRDFIPADQPTRTPEEVEALLIELHDGLIAIIQKLKTSTEQPAGQRQVSATQETNEPTTTLSATNLQQHQLAMQHARQALVQKNNSSTRAPAAPTSPQPPFTFGAQSPQGLAKYPDKPNGLTQDKLNLPLTKKRKGNQVPSATSTSVPSQGTVPPKLTQASKNTSQEAQPATPPASAIKCPIPNCQASPEGFANQTDLEIHKSEVHGPKEPPIEDPLQWTLQQVRVGIGLGNNGQSMPRLEKEFLESPKTTASTSVPGQYPTKQETSTSMTRASAQTRPSPASNLKTPQASANIKTPSSEAKSVDTQPSETIVKREAAPSPDSWANSTVSPAALTLAWSSLPDIDFIRPWSTIQSSLTPASTQSSGKSEKNSPRVSDISENDAVKISLHVEEDSDWQRPDRFEDGLYSNMEALNVDQDMLDMDWDTPFGVDDLEQTAENGVAMGKTDMTMENNDWFKIYAPDSMDQSMG